MKYDLSKAGKKETTKFVIILINIFKSSLLYGILKEWQASTVKYQYESTQKKSRFWCPTNMPSPHSNSATENVCVCDQDIVVPLYPWRMCSKTASGCLQPLIVQNPVHKGIFKTSIAPTYQFPVSNERDDIGAARKAVGACSKCNGRCNTERTSGSLFWEQWQWCQIRNKNS